MSKINLLTKAFLKSDNEELSQSIARLVFLFIINMFFIINMLITDNYPLALLSLGISLSVSAYAVAHYKWVKKYPDENHLRRLIAIMLDISSVTTGLFFLEWIGLLIYPLYIWIIIGNGMRFGSQYLLMAMILALLEFGPMPFFHPFWIEHFKVSMGLIGMIILLPLFFLVMIKRLQMANEELKKQLKIQQEHEGILIQQSRQAAMGEMISNIAHQWRQPLNALSLLIQNIDNMYDMKLLDDEYMKRSVDKATNLTQKMSHTIDDFRDFFKPNKQKILFSIAQEIHNSLNIIEASFNNANIEVVLDLEKINEYNGYPNEFSQVVLNILANAKDILIEKKIQNPKIWISMYAKDKDIIIEIVDNGGGIEADIIDKIFDPYYTTKDEGKGTGIGLYMSKLIIENHLSGMISVENNSDGAKFTIQLKI